MMGKEYSYYNRPCKCGKGNIHVTIETNDFNGSHVSEELLCEYCKLTEEKRRKEYSETTKVVISYFKDNYLEKWLLLFKCVKNKKELFTLLENHKIVNCSLNTFYKWIKGKTNDEYLKSLVYLGNISCITKIIGVHDNRLDELLVIPLRIKREYHEESIADYMRNL